MRIVDNYENGQKRLQRMTIFGIVKSRDSVFSRSDKANREIQVLQERASCGSAENRFVNSEFRVCSDQDSLAIVAAIFNFSTNRSEAHCLILLLELIPSYDESAEARSINIKLK